MSVVTGILSAIEDGDGHAADRLLPLVYEELRRLAQATALVHEAYVRLVDTEKARHWNSRGHFYAAAAEALRRILIEKARYKQRLKHGGGNARKDAEFDIACPERPERLLALDEALDRLAAEQPAKAEPIKLRYFAGLSIAEAAACMGVSPATAKRYWTVGRAWLFANLSEQGECDSS